MPYALYVCIKPIPLGKFGPAVDYSRLNPAPLALAEEISITKLLTSSGALATM